ncbi:unnamed protein product [Microthlaspi erraticum]|uniref:Uncharacterized protein n=1 Tax=Microthlaspi erraticum TaxID=1685480 RepID=A0A6D2JB19_9BRAS|nr:unnamed protein product [Microthlaspi erraticum]
MQENMKWYIQGLVFGYLSVPQRTGRQRSWSGDGRRPSGALHATGFLTRSSLRLTRSSCSSSWQIFFLKNLFLQDLADTNAEIKDKRNMYKIDMGIPPK